MDATAATPTPAVRYNRLLPYWAVFQADFKQTFNSWLYRVWVVLTLGAAVGYLMYRYGAKQVSGMVQSAPETLGDLLHWIVFGSATLIIVLTAGAICSERGSMADSVLSRGISRYQYFLGKWHARLTLVLLTFFLKAAIALVGAYFLLHSEALDLKGSLVAMLTVGVLIFGVITCGVSVSAVSNNTIVSIAVVWLVLYGGGFLLSLLPVSATFPTPALALKDLPNILKGYYDWQLLARLMLGCLSLSVLVALVGMVAFARRDV